jgi:hypothetical protein
MAVPFHCQSKKKPPESGLNKVRIFGIFSNKTAIYWLFNETKCRFRETNRNLTQVDQAAIN